MKVFIVFALSLAAVFAQACSQQAKSNTSTNNTVTPKPAASVPYPDAPRISLADAKADFDAGTAVFIDTHSATQYQNEHIAGAINIAANTIKQNLDKVPKGKKIIAYCS